MGYAVSVTIITPQYYLTLLTRPKDFRLQVGQIALVSVSLAFGLSNPSAIVLMPREKEMLIQRKSCIGFSSTLSILYPAAKFDSSLQFA